MVRPETVKLLIGRLVSRMVDQNFDPRHKMGLNTLLHIVILDYDALCPYKLRVAHMAAAAQNTNNTTIRSILLAKKLTGSNFTNWYRNLRIVLKYEKTMKFVEQPVRPPLILKLLTLILLTNLQLTLEKYNVYDMLKELKTMFEEQAKQELFETVKAFHACKQEEGQSVSSNLLKMKGYLDTLERLSYVIPNELGVSLILNSLNKNYDQLVQNYNMHSMGKTIVELHAMLKLNEKVFSKKAETPAVLAIREGKIQKDKKKLQGAKGKDKGKNKLD
ncbi:hypothetical protein Tco_0727111 [Tanacetum coccineum]|uniref:Zinc finger, CCHC-type n=1 Tax=Tanacetum coccineum TaxID=301880 RepID=A0ABQ4YJQ9_9ASTR